MKKEFITFNNISHSYSQESIDGNMVLRSINQIIREGEYIAVIGGNGSGKTTLAKHINGFLLPSCGSVFVNGLDTRLKKNLPNTRQLVGMVFQNPENQIVSSVVEEDVAFGPENLGIKPFEIENRVKEALEIVGLTEYRQYSSEILSGGQKQRLAIAGALAMHPKCLVLDEATSMLDESGRQKVLGILRKLNQVLGVTIVQITHIMEEAALADRVWVLRDGQVFLNGPPKVIFKNRNELQKCGLEIPDMAEIAWGLEDAGFDSFSDVPLSVEEMILYLCK